MRARRRRSQRVVAVENQRPVVKVLTEGDVTERQYLREMADQGIGLDLSESGFVPMSLVERAREHAKRNRRRRRDDRFDEIWCVFDHDEHPDVSRAIQEARDQGVKVAFSNPCFELWLVLHVEDQTAHIGRHGIQSRCRDLGLLDGKWIVPGMLDMLREAYPSAKERAIALGRMHDRDGSPAGEPEL